MHRAHRLLSESTRILCTLRIGRGGTQTRRLHHRGEAFRSLDATPFSSAYVSIVSGSWRAVANLVRRRRLRCMRSSAQRTSQRAGVKMASAPHRGDKQTKPSPFNVSTAYLLNIFFGPASTLQRFNDSRHRGLNVKSEDRPQSSNPIAEKSACSESQRSPHTA